MRWLVAIRCTVVTLLTLGPTALRACEVPHLVIALG